ncbi:MAG: DnaJ domain protein [Candidatus Aerophobetes bacterium ADurb.Bin490]|nr:MAG: DnaJ domain protein [Candidatus Aerophobetes bacterium ADurb.Bin490]
MKMPFGKYKNCFLSELPDAYLEWLRFDIDLREPLRTAIFREYYERFETAERAHREEKALSIIDSAAIKRIYRTLAQQYHPDRIGGNGDVMKGINLFYEEIKQ